MRERTARLALVAAIFVLAACQPAAELATTGVATAADQPQPIDPFVGYWQGTSAPDGAVLRDATVIVERDPGQAFTITWKNFSTAGDAPGLVLRENTLRFVPSGLAGLWRAEDSGDLLTGFSAWASIADDTLTVDVLAVGEDGRLERQTYLRTVSGDAMALLYTRRKDGAEDREIRGALVRLAAD